MTLLLIALVTFAAMVVFLAISFKLLWDWISEKKRREEMVEKEELRESMDLLDAAFRVRHKVPPRPTMPRPPPLLGQGYQPKNVSGRRGDLNPPPRNP